MGFELTLIVQTMGSPRRYCPLHTLSLSHDTVCTVVGHSLTCSCVNRRRMKRGGAPYRYTGWTVPMYNNPQQQYNYPNTYNMNSYPQGQGGSYQGQPQHGDYENNAPVYYDATRTQAGNVSRIPLVDSTDGYQAPSYPPPVGKPPVRD